MPATKSSGYWIVGVLISILGAVCFSTKAIFVKLAYQDFAIDAITLLALRMLFALPFFVVSALLASQKKDNVPFTGKQWIYVAFIGCLGYYVSSLLDFLGLQYVSAGIERLILFIYPTFVLLISAWWFRKKVSRKEWFAVAVTYLGLIIAFSSEVSIGNSGPDFYLGSILILVCALTYASYIAGSGRLIPEIGAVKFNSYAMSFASVAVLVHFFIASNQSLAGLPFSIYAYSFSMAVISTVIPSYLVSMSINRLGANTTAIIASIGPLSTILQAHYFLDEPVSFLQLAGTVFILGGVLLISWKPKKFEVVQP